MTSIPPTLHVIKESKIKIISFNQYKIILKYINLAQLSLANLVDNVNNNNLHIYYQKEDSLFKQKIDKLNLKFYLETEKYLTNQHNDAKCQESLFIILFQQISLYIEEIERLNIILQEKNGDPNFIKNRVEEYMRKQKDFETKEKLIFTLKESKMNLEKKLSKLMTQEDKIKSENERLKRQNKFYQEQLQVYLSNNDINFDINNFSYSRQKIKRNYSDNNTINNNNQYNNSMCNGSSKEESNNTSNVDHAKSNGQINNSTSNSVNNINKNKKDIKIIKSIKEQTNKNISGESNTDYSTNSNKVNTYYNNNPNIKMNFVKPIIRCKSPTSNTTSYLTLFNKESIKSAIEKCDNELKEISLLEIYLIKLKNDILNKKNNDDSYKNSNFNKDNYISNLFKNDYDDKHIKSEIIVSDLEDYNHEPNKKKTFFNITSTNQSINSYLIKKNFHKNEDSQDKNNFNKNECKKKTGIKINNNSNEGKLKK